MDKKIPFKTSGRRVRGLHGESCFLLHCLWVGEPSKELCCRLFIDEAQRILKAYEKSTKPKFGALRSLLCPGMEAQQVLLTHAVNVRKKCRWVQDLTDCFLCWHIIFMLRCQTCQLAFALGASTV